MSDMRYNKVTGEPVQVLARNGEGGVFVQAPHGKTWFLETDLTADAMDLHGMERNRHVQHTCSTLETDQFSVGYIGHSLTVAEKFCGHCRKWTSTAGGGLLGHVVAPCCNQTW